MLIETDIKCKPFIATEVVDGVTYTLRIARATDRVSTIIKASDGRYFRDTNTHFRWGTGPNDNEIIEEQMLHSLGKIGAPQGLFDNVYNELIGLECASNPRFTPWYHVRYDFLVCHTLGYSINEVDNMNEAEFENLVKQKQK